MEPMPLAIGASNTGWELNEIRGFRIVTAKASRSYVNDMEFLFPN
jgi:hypothetical protein